jgi:hypothetical protein
MHCSVCGGELRHDNQTGLCSKTAACRAEKSRRWREEMAKIRQRYKEGK